MTQNDDKQPKRKSSRRSSRKKSKEEELDEDIEKKIEAAFRLNLVEAAKKKKWEIYFSRNWVKDILEEEENGKVEVKPFYSAIELRNERGSKFSFKTEIHRSNLSEEDVF